MPFAAAIPYVASAIGTGVAANSANKASAAQTKAANKGKKEVRADLSPYRMAGNAALTRLQSLLGISTAPVAPTKDQFISRGGGGKDLIDPLGLDKYGVGPRHVFPGLSSIFGGGGKPEKKFHAGAYNSAMDKYNHDLGDYNSTVNSSDYGSLLKNFSKSDLENDPVYNTSLDFGLNEGEKAINNRSIANGGYDSGSTLKALTRYASDYGGTKANESYNRFNNDNSNKYSRLFGLSGLGESAASQQASNISNLDVGTGNANAAAEIAKGNAYTNLGNNVGDYYALSKLTPAGQRTV